MDGMINTSKIKRCIAVMIIGAMLGACSGKNENGTTVKYYPTCHQPLEETKNLNSASAIGKSAASGAVRGGVIGMISGTVLGIITGRPSTAVTGAVVGATTGAVSGAMSAGEGENAETENKLRAKYYEQIDGDISDLDARSAAATVSLQCYNKKFTQLVQSIKDRSISLNVAESRMTEIQSGKSEALAILGPDADKDPNQQTEFDSAIASAGLR